MTVQKGNTVSLSYTGTLDDGTVFDASEKHGKPLEFKAGEGQVIPGFDHAVLGMKEGEEKTFRLESKDAYGDPKENMIHKIPRESLPKDQEPVAGMQLSVGLPNGMQVPAKIVEVGEKDVTIDLNHPLAGKVLTFKVKVEKIAD